MFGFIFDTIKSIWDVMSDVFVINFYNSSLSLAEFLVGLIVAGVILSIFLSFVNIDSIRPYGSFGSISDHIAAKSISRKENSVDGYRSTKERQTFSIPEKTKLYSREKRYADMYNSQLNNRKK